MHISASSIAYGLGPLQHVLGSLFQQPSSSAGQNSPSTAPAGADASASPPSPSSPGRQFASQTLAALLGVQQQAPSASDLASSLIGQADSDGDGELSQSELAKALGLGGHSTSNEAMKTAVAKLDSDGDGKLSASELTAALQQRPSQFGGHHHHHGVSSAGLASRIIGAADSDGDGSLSQAELSSELGKAGLSMSSADFSSAFGKLDSNGDGALSGAELAAAIDALRGKTTSTTTTATAGDTTTSPTTTV
jgi:Ca2+-binding EF-hand superfamily protein